MCLHAAGSHTPAAAEAPEFEYKQGWPKVQANPTEGFKGGADAGRRCTLSRTHGCMHESPHARTYAHARIPVYTDARANAQTYTHMHARMHILPFVYNHFGIILLN